MFSMDSNGTGVLSEQLALYRTLDSWRRGRENQQMYALNLQWQQAYDQVVGQREEIRAQREQAVRAHNSLLDRHEALQVQHKQLIQNHNALERQRAQLAIDAADLAERLEICRQGAIKDSDEASGWLDACLKERAERKRLTAENEALRTELKAFKPPSGS